MIFSNFQDLFEIEQVPPSNDADEDNSKENPTEPSAEPGPVTNSSCSSNAVVDNSKPDIAGCQPTQQQWMDKKKKTNRIWPKTGPWVCLCGAVSVSVKIP